jgi:hypothetical protein
MEPLRGNAEQISARTAAVMDIKTIVIRKQDLRSRTHPSGYQSGRLNIPPDF